MGMPASPGVYFFPHPSLRDRQLDTIRRWPADQVLNPQLLQERGGAQVSRDRALAEQQRLSWKQRLPLLNVKWRPKGLPRDAAVYVWGAIMAAGPFIVDLDNPYALTGYNIKAMSLYRGVIRRLLSSPRCLSIRCLSQACRETVMLVLGQQVYERSCVQYPYIRRMVEKRPARQPDRCHFLFVGTQFEIKGGVALLRAFRRVYEAAPTAHLDIVTHLPSEYASLAASCPGITVHEARFTREGIFTRFMRHADVLVHPTYMESFGMVVLEALAHGLAVVATDVYALREMVQDGVNGVLLPPPISVWEGVLPSPYYADWPMFKEHVRRTDTRVFEAQLAQAMLRLAQNPAYLLQARRASLTLLDQTFVRASTIDG